MPCLANAPPTISPSDNKDPGRAIRRKRRKGHGFRYEERVIALVFLRCLTNQLPNFELTSDNRSVWDIFDDIVVTWNSLDDKYILLVQLKHKVSKKYKVLREAHLFPKKKNKSNDKSVVNADECTDDFPITLPKTTAVTMSTAKPTAMLSIPMTVSKKNDYVLDCVNDCDDYAGDCDNNDYADDCDDYPDDCDDNHLNDFVDDFDNYADDYVNDCVDDCDDFADDCDDNYVIDYVDDCDDYPDDYVNDCVDDCDDFADDCDGNYVNDFVDDFDDYADDFDDNDDYIVGTSVNYHMLDYLTNYFKKNVNDDSDDNCSDNSNDISYKKHPFAIINYSKSFKKFKNKLQDYSCYSMVLLTNVPLKGSAGPFSRMIVANKVAAPCSNIVERNKLLDLGGDMYKLKVDATVSKAIKDDRDFVGHFFFHCGQKHVEQIKEDICKELQHLLGCPGLEETNRACEELCHCVEKWKDGQCKNPEKLTSSWSEWKDIESRYSVSGGTGKHSVINDTAKT